MTFQPEQARDIFKSFDDFRNYNNSLEQTVNLYNYLKLHIAQQEYNLIDDEVADLDEKLEMAEVTLTWNSPNIWNYVEGIRKDVDGLVKRVKQAQDNVGLIIKETAVWEKSPIFQRIADPKEEPLLNLKDREANKATRYEELKEASKNIQKILDENEKLFRANALNDSSKVHWDHYLLYLDEIVSNGKEGCYAAIRSYP